jgi:sec-independent protein translocase protein TatC
VLSFQLPLVMLVLGWTGVVPPSFVARYRRHCIFICFALGAVLTPSTDVVSMMVMSLPLWGLFEFGLVLMRLNYRPRSLPW